MNHSGHMHHDDVSTALPVTTTMHDMGMMHSTQQDHGNHGNHGEMAHGSAMDHGMSMDHDMDMMMYFHARISEIILFKTWHPTSLGGLIGSMIGIFLMALFYEGLKYYREYLFRRTYASANFNCIGVSGDGPKVLPNPLNSVKNRMLHPSHLAQTILHMIQVTLSYFLMLIFMTYNVWLCLAVILGAGLGFFIFGWKKAIVVDITEHCH